MRVAERLEEFRKEKGLTQKELSKLSGVPLGTYVKIINGATKDPTIETARLLVTTLGKTLDELCDINKEGLSRDAIEVAGFYELAEQETKNGVRRFLGLREYREPRKPMVRMHPAAYGGGAESVDIPKESLDRLRTAMEVRTTMELLVAKEEKKRKARGKWRFR